MKITELTLGILTAVGGFVDVSELVFMAQAGSRFQYALVWVVVLATIGMMVAGVAWIATHGGLARAPAAPAAAAARPRPARQRA